jgi:hypothetical protein
MRVNAAGADLPLSLPVTEPGAGRRASGPAFADLYAASMAKAPASAVTAETRKLASAAAQAKDEAATKVSKKETYLPVEGKNYEEIVSGPRNGMFINRSGNSRDGEAFLLVKRGSREYHIYGSGADRDVVRVDAGAKSGDTKTDTTKPDTTKTDTTTGTGKADAKPVAYKDVPGRAFDEITSGRQNGMFINRSGNKRDGEAFLLVERKDRELHIYGSGKNRLVVTVIPPDKRDKADETKASEDSKSSSPTTSTQPSGAGAGLVLS